MYYQNQLLSVGNAGHFVSAVCHAKHKVGGDDPRETSYASLNSGHVDSLDALQDLAPVAFPLLRASPSRVASETNAARIQDELAASGEYSANQSNHYRDNAKRYRHAARMAASDRIRVPRHVLASRAGRIVLGFEPENANSTGESLPGTLRLIDALAGSSIGDWSSSRFPVDGPGKGIERYSNVQLGRPIALAADGGSVVLAGIPKRPGLVECRLDESLSEIGTGAFGRDRILGIDGGWIALGDELAQRLCPGLRWPTKLELPKGVLGWGGVATPDGTAMLLPTMTGGEFHLIGWDGAKPRRFTAHRGARRDATTVLAISDCGQWIASRCDRDVVLTRVADGVSWPVAELEDRVHDDPSYDGYLIRSLVPAGFGFVGSRLLVHDESGVREVSLGEVEGRQFVSEAGRTGARKPIAAKPSMPFEELMRAARLDAPADALRRFHSPAISIEPKALGSAGWLTWGKEGAPEIGGSRLGGWPDLPEGTPWPTWRGRPMAFLAQIDLADVADVQPQARLPKEGLLSFFLGCGEETYEKHDDPRTRYMANELVGTESDQADGWRVIYTPHPERLRRTPWKDSPIPALYEPHAVRFAREGLSLPDEQTAIYDYLPLDHGQRDDYNELIEQLTPKVERASEQLMGYPSLIQFTPPELMCELASSGRDPHSFPEHRSKEWESLARKASEWTLLLQLTSNRVFEWGDGGHFYFYGDREAMARGDFSRIWVNFEC
jgi:uncharacterized protein YwqG